MGIAFVIVIFVCIVSGILNVMHHYDLKKIAQQIKEVNETEQTNERIRTSTHVKAINEVTDGINDLIDLQILERTRHKKAMQSQKEEWANVSHDLRTPLTSLRGYMEVIQNETLNETDRQHYLSVMERKVDDLIGRINVFYDVSLIESESIKIQREYVEINGIINEVLLLYFKEIENKNIEIQVPEAVHEAFVDKQATFRIINNIIVNAIRFAEAYIRIEYLTTGEKCIVTIENDTSQKITNPARLFERSVMGDTSRQGAHNGLGLYIVKVLMELQGGEASIEVEEKLFKMKLVFDK